MQAMVLCDVAKLELREIWRPIPGPHDILVRVAAVGLCGTDFHIFSGLNNFNKDQRGKPIPLTEIPQILGHEIVGVVAEVGKDVKDLHVGDRVIIDQVLNCFSRRRQPSCEYCATGDSHQCQFGVEYGITGEPGGFAEYIAIPSVNAIRINSDLDNISATIAEPLGCIIHALDMTMRSRTRYAIGAEDDAFQVHSILIFGAGPAGLLFTQYLRQELKYEGLILVSEPVAKKRELAASFGAETLDPQSVDITEAIQEKTHGRKVEFVIDACGSGSAFKALPDVIRKQSTILLYGLGHSGLDLSILNHFQILETTLVAACGASGGFDMDGRPLTYIKALELIESEKIKVTPWISHRYQSLQELPKAFTHDYKEPNYIKGVVLP